MNKFARIVRKPSVKGAIAGLAMVPVFSHAAIDTTAALAGITDAQTALLAVLGGVLTLGIAVWGLRKVVKFFRG
jgi:hypothetical protein